MIGLRSKVYSIYNDMETAEPSLTDKNEIELFLL